MTVFAGSTQGFRNAVGTDAQFNSPNGIAIDSAGNLYIADSGNNCIRKVTPAGLVSTLAGGVQGNLEGTGTSAEFNSPYGLAVGPDGTVYVADTYNNCIRKIAPNGVTGTLAGSGTAGYKDGTSSVAEFNLPFSLTLDSNGNLYVADAGNNRIRKVSPLGDVTTLAGNGISGLVDGSALDASFSIPNDVVVDSNGNVFVADYGNNSVREISFSGQVSTLSGTGILGYQDGSGRSAQFDHPTGLAIAPDGTLYIADNGNDRVRSIRPDGQTSTLAGAGASGMATGNANTAEFNGLTDIVAASNGALFVVDTSNNRICVIK